MAVIPARIPSLAKNVIYLSATTKRTAPGNLRRMYIDRITSPSVSISKKELLCPQGHLLGIKINYEKEDRPAYRLFVDAVVKIVTSSKKVR